VHSTRVVAVTTSGPTTTSQTPMRDRGKYAISWEAQVPADVQDGPATLSASTARLDVQIVRSATQGADGGDPGCEGTERGRPDR